VGALVRVEQQRAGDGVEDASRDLDVPGLLEPRVPRDPDRGEVRHLLAAQAGRAAARSARQAHALGGDALAAAAQEGGQLAAADA
jgi:hypothetical protein